MCPFQAISIRDQSGLNLYLLKALVIEHAQSVPESTKPGLQARQVVLDVELQVSQKGTVQIPTVESVTHVFSFGMSVNPALHSRQVPVESEHLPQLRGQLTQSLVEEET